MSLPCGTVDGLPVGMMLVGKLYDEPTIYKAAHAFEQGVDWQRDQGVGGERRGRGEEGGGSTPLLLQAGRDTNGPPTPAAAEQGGGLKGKHTSIHMRHGPAEEKPLAPRG